MTTYFVLNNAGKEHIKLECAKFVKEKYLSDNYLENITREIEAKDLIKDTETGFEMIKDHFEIPGIETKSGNPELIDLSVNMYMATDEL